MAEPCIARAIWDRALALGHDTDTAQGRAALDLVLRTELAVIQDTTLRAHTADMLRDLRRRAFFARRHGVDIEAVADLFIRVAAIEAFLGLTPKKSGFVNRGEITTFRQEPRNG